jgi:APA family basic amino acid/polyamine antiporter
LSVSSDSNDSGFSAATVLSVVVANMIGTGVFTSLGFQLLDIQSGFVLLMLWVVGGLIAVCGALSYAELGAALPRSGGEFNFLSRIYHPGVGFVSGALSATIGFAAPTALAAMTFGAYLNSVVGWLDRSVAALVLIVLLTGAHAVNRRSSGAVQRWFTGVKILLIVGFCVAGLLLTERPQPLAFLPVAGDGVLLTSGVFAVALIYVNYAYTGWNAGTYLSGEVQNPQRTLPWVLAAGTAIVMAVYVALNYTFLRAAPMADMEGKLEVGYVVAQHIFGAQGAAIMGIVLALLLVSTASSMILAGPRVLQVMGEDFGALRVLARTNRYGIPVNAVVCQSVISVLLVLTASFESVLVFATFTLGMSSLATVAGVFVLRWREPGLMRPYRVTAYPLPPLIFLALTAWTLLYLAMERPLEAGLGAGLIVMGAAVYFLLVRVRREG